jgi:two-component system chemotaxis response regulator CheY
MIDQNKKVLVVDDSSTMRQLIKMMLMKCGKFDLSEAVDGADAFEKIGNERFDLVLTDINMPNMTGLDLVKKVREAHGPVPPMVIITTKGSEGDRNLGMELGANAYVTKPISSAKLSEAVKSFL